MHSTKLNRRRFGGLIAGLAGTAATSGAARATAPDGSGAIKDMMVALQSASAMVFMAETNYGASVAKAKLLTLGSVTKVIFNRSGKLLATSGTRAVPDAVLLVDGGTATLFRPAVGARAVVSLAPQDGGAFAVTGMFLPWLGLLSADVGKDFFGGIASVTPLAEGAPDQPETTTLAAVMGSAFTGEVWVDRDNGRPARVIGTWFDSGGDRAASAAVNLSGWSDVVETSAFEVKGLAEAKTVALDALGL